MPKLRRREDPEAEEDRRVLEEVQQLSLREVGITGNSLEPPRERRRRERSRDGSRSSRNSARDDGRSRSRNRPEPSREVIPPRHVEHQSSLRSLLSASELDSQEIEEEIMRQIMEDGLLDGIDLNNIDAAQEDEISERIAQAYRARQLARQRERRERRERVTELFARGSEAASSSRTPPLREDEQARRRAQSRSESGTSTPSGPPPSGSAPSGQASSRPPVSRPALIDAANNNQGRSHHGRSSSQGSSRSSRRAERPPALSLGSQRQASGSATDLSSRPSTSDAARPARRRQSENQQRSTLDERQQFRTGLQLHSSSNPNSPRRAGFNLPTAESPSGLVPGSAPLTSTLQPPNARRTTDPTSVRQARQTNVGAPPILSPATFPRSTRDEPPRESSSRLNSLSTTQNLTASPPEQYREPAVSCMRCAKEHIEYDLYYNCSRCDGGSYNLCRSCYRAGKGCKHWYGFGWAAWPSYQKRAPPGGYSPSHEYPHILVGHRYRRPATPLTESTGTPPTLMSGDDPSKRLESGVFCDICKSLANHCYWKCDICNEGEWGFCSDCVYQGRHCTHPLLPIARKLPTDGDSHSRDEAPTTSHLMTSPQGQGNSSATPPLTPSTASLIDGPGTVTIANTTFRPLTFRTFCNKCKLPIPPSHTRYHCLHCNKGDYDLCTSCYHQSVKQGRITRENGPNGWRRCIRGHRMVVIGFEDRDGGQRRVVVRDLVGGFSLRDVSEEAPSSASATADSQPRSPTGATWRDSDGSVHRYRTPASPSSPAAAASTLRFPPDGGIGLRVQARWSYFPAEDDQDELGFPKYAEIREAEDMNGDWFWGVYAGQKGLFPGAYVRVLGGREELGRLN